jgi:hypothetical protein
MRYAYKILVQKYEETDPFRDLGVDWRVILNLPLEKQNVWM